MLVIFAGGPGAGKSSCIAGLQNRIKPEFKGRVRCIPEIFGEIFGRKMPSEIFGSLENEKVVLIRQWVIGAVELLLQKMMVEATDNGTIVFSDRGFFDLEGYLSREECDIIYQAVPKTESANYDLCLLFLHDEDGRNLRSDLTTMRIENDLTERNEIARKTETAWRTHTPAEKLLEIPQFQTPAEKVTYVAGLLNARLGEEIFEV